MHTNLVQIPRTSEEEKIINEALSCFEELKKFKNCKPNIIRHVHKVFNDHKYMNDPDKRGAHVLIKHIILGFVATLDL